MRSLATPQPAAPRVTAVPGQPAGRRRRAAPLGRPPVLDPSHVRPSPHRPPRPLDAAPTGSDTLGDPTGICVAIVRASLEVLNGGRPLAQLIRWVEPEIYEALGRRAAVLRRAAEAAAPCGLPLTVLRARTVRIGANVAEAAVVVKDGERVRAAAIRVEARRGAWRVTALEIG
ncbi:hypothetical protein SAMN04489860_1215 [Paraoerskovia marina]|uniref:3-hydroxyacyl-CoA dehydrogenase n=1 Tax=Paraoerskovia marina TaxID=545619 RepID=A0A1H1QZC4_9CELL|nr:Rv3235 family protein [Paraoerskovia marina]SDS28726.1 hypothetical protein SAMN04489860_1215 [Paraoerskovia marina]